MFPAAGLRLPLSHPFIVTIITILGSSFVIAPACYAKIYRYKQFPGGDQNQKPLLYIGGIFPISASTKFTAPELVPGEGNHIIMI